MKNSMERSLEEFENLTIEQEKQIYEEFDSMFRAVKEGRPVFSFPEITPIVASKFNVSIACAYLAYSDYRTKKLFGKL